MNNQMETISVNNLKKGYSIFGNKGAVWGKTCHIKRDGFASTTLCGTPMLSSNYAQSEKVETIGCSECIKVYKQILNNTHQVLDLIYTDREPEQQAFVGSEIECNEFVAEQTKHSAFSTYMVTPLIQ
jgi:hypothetical protein